MPVIDPPGSSRPHLRSSAPAGPADDGRGTRGVSPHELRLLDSGDLASFWTTRLQKDPVARIGLGMWGKTGAIANAIKNASDDELRYWKPDGSLLARLFVTYQAPLLDTTPETRSELCAYWSWLSENATKGLSAALDRHHPAGDSAPLRRSIGLALGKAHAAAVTADLDTARGIPGLLSAEQVAAYHHAVFAEFGLPTSTYGGTPSVLIPDMIELCVGAGIYASGSDPTA